MSSRVLSSATSPHRSPELSASTGTKWLDPAASVRICELEGMSQRRTVPSFEPDRTLRPRAIIAVEVMARVCPRSVRAGLTLTVVYDEDCGGSAGKMESEKSAPAERMTRDDGKKRIEETVLRWDLLKAVGGDADEVVERMYTDPSW